MTITKVNDRLLNFASEIDDQTLTQAEETASMPFIHPHVALMPDAHYGKGSSVGTVIPTTDAVIPAAVGVDIGCGMIAAEVGYNAHDIAGLNLTELRESIESAIPMSAGRYNKALDRFPFTSARIGSLHALSLDDGVDLSHSPNWALQLGTLGGGNHFIELCLDDIVDEVVYELELSRDVVNKLLTPLIRFYDANMRQIAMEQSQPEPLRHWAKRVMRQMLALIKGRL